MIIYITLIMWDSQKKKKNSYNVFNPLKEQRVKSIFLE